MENTQSKLFGDLDANEERNKFKRKNEYAVTSQLSDPVINQYE